MEPTSFITEVQGQKQLPDPHELLVPVKAEHVKLQEVIGMFSRKVDTLVDKQRHEYTQAYEYHMFEIQKELHRLREKATAIANDTTRDEKLANLNKDQKWFRAEAMRLDTETNQMRRVLRTLTGKISAAEKERDWLLQKLRDAKTVFAELESERAEMPHFGMDGESSLASTESSYTLELMSSRYLKKNATGMSSELPFQDPSNWKAKVNTGSNFVSRTGQDARLDKYMTGSAGDSGRANSARRATSTLDAGRPQRREVDPERELRAELVTMRTRQEHCRNFIAHCGNSAASGPWSKRSSRNVQDVLSDCVGVIESNYYGVEAQSDGEYNELAAKIESLASELALCPETYYAISELFSAGNRSTEQETADPSRSGQQEAPPTDQTEQTEWEDMSSYDDEGLFAGMEPDIVPTKMS